MGLHAERRTRARGAAHHHQGRFLMTVHEARGPGGVSRDRAAACTPLTPGGFAGSCVVSLKGRLRGSCRGEVVARPPSLRPARPSLCKLFTPKKKPANCFSCLLHSGGTEVLFRGDVIVCQLSRVKRPVSQRARGGGVPLGIPGKTRLCSSFCHFILPQSADSWLKPTSVGGGL